MLYELAPRRKTLAVKVAGVSVGGGAPVVVQSMTNTDTADIEKTALQVAQLAQAGSELVRITVDRDEAAAAVPHIRDKLAARGVKVPLVGDFHYIGHKLLADHPACAEALDKYRINPGNVGFRAQARPAILQHHRHRAEEWQAGADRRQLGQPRRGIADPADGRKCVAAASRRDARAVLHEAIVQSALLSAERAVGLGMAADRIILSAKVSAVQDLISVYSMLAARGNYALHLGLTEAGMGTKGIVASTAGIGILLQQGIGDTIRVSLTPAPGEARTREVEVAQQILQTMGLRSFVPVVAACPGCGRTTSTRVSGTGSDIQNHIAASMPEWRKTYPGVEAMTVAVMGCIVNGPGESKHADIGISLPGTGESPAAPVFIDGKKALTLRGPAIADDFKKLVQEYIERSFGRGEAGSSIRAAE